MLYVMLRGFCLLLSLAASTAAALDERWIFIAVNYTS